MPTDNEGHVLNLPPLESATDSLVPASTGRTPLGMLSVLPRELRDKIYWHVQEKEYNVWGVSSPYYYYKQLSRITPHLPTVTLSKIIRRESLVVLHAKAVFVFQEDYDYYIRSGIPFIDRFQNLKYYTPVNCVNWELRAKPISFFTGTEVLRNSCSIKFLALPQDEIELLRSPLIGALKNLTGFKTVSVKLKEPKCDEEDRLRPEQKATCVGPYFGTEVVIRNALEPSLGPSVMSEIGEEGRFDTHWKLTFHPRDHISKAKVTEPSSSTQKDEGGKSLPQAVSS